MNGINSLPNADESKEQLHDGLEHFVNSNEAPDDESSNSSLNRRLLCLVCGANARGYNFGVTACESCKAFFRRNALRREMRPCCHGGKCSIHEYNRKACPSCRINKCFEVGMKKELIHPPERLMMRAKPKSWHHNRRNHKTSSEVPQASDNSRNYPTSPSSNVLSSHVENESHSVDKKDFFINEYLILNEGIVDNDDSVPSTAKAEERLANSNPVLMNIIDKNRGRSPDKDSANKQTHKDHIDIGVTCYPMVDIDDSYYYLSSKFNFVLAMAKGPLSYNPSENSVQLSANPTTVEDGFAMYEYIIKRMVSTLVHMPHFNSIDRSIFIDIVKEKLFGAAQIFSCLYFEPSKESWVLLISLQDGLVKEECLECATFFYNAFRYLTRPHGMASVAVLKMGDVDAIFKANMNSFERICKLSQNNGVFIIALIGYYLTLDESFNNSDKLKQLNDIMKIYERFLMQMCYVISGKFDVCEFYRDLIGIMQVVKWIEARYCDLGKYMEKDRLPPLLKEILGNDSDEKTSDAS